MLPCPAPTLSGTRTSIKVDVLDPKSVATTPPGNVITAGTFIFVPSIVIYPPINALAGMVVIFGTSGMIVRFGERISVPFVVISFTFPDTLPGTTLTVMELAEPANVVVDQLPSKIISLTKSRLVPLIVIFGLLAVLTVVGLIIAIVGTTKFKGSEETDLFASVLKLTHSTV